MPLLGSRGGGSVRGFGRFGRTLLLFLTDSFNRSTSSILGPSSDGKGIWKNVVGIWQSNGSSAVSLSLPAAKNVAVVDMDGTNITNLQVDTGGNGGSGLSFWVSSANSYYALYPTYTSSSSTSTGCTGYQTFTGGGCANICANCTNSSVTYYYCIEHRYYPSDPFVYYIVTGSPSNCYQPNGNAWSNYQRGYPEGSQETVTFRSGNTSQTTTTTTYNSIANLIKVENGTESALVANTYSTNTSGFSKAQSIAISTSNNTISYSFHSSTNKGGSTIASGNSTPSNPIKGQGVGLFHGPSTVDQGSTLSNFSATVSP